MAHYSLAKYILSISIPSSIAQLFGLNSLSIGGSGSYLNSMSINYNADLWTTEGDVTGSYVHNENRNRTGTVTVTLSQLSDRVRQFITLCNIYFSSQEITEGLTLELRSIDGTMIATCNDCMVTKIPPQDFQATAGQQSWVFTCGEISMH